MNVLDFIEELQDVTRGTGGTADSFDVIFETKDGQEFIVDSVELLYNSNLLVLGEKSDDDDE